MKCVNIKLWDLLGCFHYILNAPRMLYSCFTENAYHSISSIRGIVLEIVTIHAISQVEPGSVIC